MEDALNLACLSEDGLVPYSHLLKKLFTDQTENNHYFSHQKLFF
jgi:hypothetical protein